MIDFLLGVPGKLKAISDYLTGTLYPYITSRTANLDAAVTSRAAASTALTNATWTDTRAGRLDLLNGATAGLLGSIKSIQRGSVSVGGSGIYSATATITAVNLSKSVCYNNGHTSAAGDETCAVQITSSTQVTGYRGIAGGSSTSVIYFTVVEWY